MRLKDKIAIVTGGAKGIGRKIVELFLQQGAKVYAVDYDSDSLEAFKAEVGNDRLRTYKVDIAFSDQVKDFFHQFSKEENELSILVNNAGITRDKLFIRMKEEDWRQVIRVNLGGAFLMSRAAVRIMMKARKGSIINISSVISLMGGVGQANYASSKAGLLGLTRALANELAAKNIRVNAILPGFIQTGMTEALPDNVKEDYLKQIPVGRFGKPEDVASAALFLASDEASYITGHFLVVDGGLSF